MKESYGTNVDCYCSCGLGPHLQDRPGLFRVYRHDARQITDLLLFLVCCCPIIKLSTVQVLILNMAMAMLIGAEPRVGLPSRYYLPGLRPGCIPSKNYKFCTRVSVGSVLNSLAKAPDVGLV